MVSFGSELLCRALRLGFEVCLGSRIRDFVGDLPTNSCLRLTQKLPNKPTAVKVLCVNHVKRSFT